MRLFLLSLAITLASSFTSVLAAPGDVWLVYHADEQFRVATTSGERWIGSRPEPGKNVPVDSVVLKFIPTDDDTDPWHYTRTNNRLIYTPPQPEVQPEPTEAEQKVSQLESKLDELATDESISDEKFVKLLRAKFIKDKTKAAEQIDRAESKEAAAIQEQN